MKRKRLVLDGVYTRDGDPIDGDLAVSEAIVREWPPVFAAREVDAGEMRYSVSFMPEGDGRTTWTWPRGAIRDTAARATHSAPGPDGIPDAFWSTAFADVIAFLGGVAEDMARGVPPPRQFMALLTLFLPKGDYDVDLERVIRRIIELRPKTLMQTSAKVVASVVNDELSRIAKVAVAGEQRGFVEGDE